MELRAWGAEVRVACWLGLAVWLALSLGTRSSRAENEPSEQLIQDGLSLRRAGRDAEALELFQRAQKESPSSRAVAQVALAEQALGRWVDAETHLRQALAGTDPWVVERRAFLLTALEDVRAQLGSLDVRADPLGAEVLLDGQSVGTFPLPLQRLTIGSYEVVVRKSGFKAVTRIVQIRPRVITRAVFTLTPISEPAAKPVPESDSGVKPPRAPRTDDSWRRTAAWIGFANAGLFLIGSMAAHVIREREIAVYNDDSRCLYGNQSRNERCGDHLQAAETAQTLAVLGYTATGAFLGTGIALLAVDASRSPDQGSNGLPGRYSGAMLTVSHRFR